MGQGSAQEKGGLLHCLVNQQLCLLVTVPHCPTTRRERRDWLDVVRDQGAGAALDARGGQMFEWSVR